MKYIAVLLAILCSHSAFGVSLKTYTEVRDDRVVKQVHDYTCGAASLATILNEYYSHTLTEEVILAGMDIDNKTSLSFLDLSQYVEKLGYQAYGYQIDFSKMRQILRDTGIPILSYVKIDTQDHFLVIRDISEDNDVYVADPSRGNMTYKYRDFIKIWEQFSQKGRVLVVVPQKKGANIDTTFTLEYFPSSINTYKHNPLQRVRK